MVPSLNRRSSLFSPQKARYCSLFCWSSADGPGERREGKRKERRREEGEKKRRRRLHLGQRLLWWCFEALTRKRDRRLDALSWAASTCKLKRSVDFVPQARCIPLKTWSRAGNHQNNHLYTLKRFEKFVRHIIVKNMVKWPKSLERAIMYCSSYKPI